MTDNKVPGVGLLGSSSKQTCLGPTVSLNGEISGGEDLLIDGKIEGTIKVPEHCVTVGSQGQVKAEIHARQVIILGSVYGNVSARDKVEIRKTGRLEGDLVAAGIAIEEGAYLKGSIDITRGESQPAPSRSLVAGGAVKTSV